MIEPHSIELDLIIVDHSIFWAIHSLTNPYIKLSGGQLVRGYVQLIVHIKNIVMMYYVQY